MAQTNLAQNYQLILRTLELLMDGKELTDDGQVILSEQENEIEAILLYVLEDMRLNMRFH